MKKRSRSEIDKILEAFQKGVPLIEISKKYEITEASIYRLLSASKGVDPYAYKKKSENKIAKLERALAEREKEIALLKSALKKS